MPLMAGGAVGPQPSPGRLGTQSVVSQHRRWQEEKPGWGHPSTLAVVLPLWEHETPIPYILEPCEGQMQSRTKARQKGQFWGMQLPQGTRPECPAE